MFQCKITNFYFQQFQVILMFRGCKTEDMTLHIYSLSQTAYRAMLETRIDQSLIFMGRSGSRKTKSFKLSLYFLTLAAGKNFMDFFLWDLVIERGRFITIELTHFSRNFH
jgi:myosin heavy subunit